MTDAILEFIASWGVWALAATTFLSCLALPVPSSLAMLGAGALVASGDMSLAAVAAAAFLGAVIGDHVGFIAGRFGAATLLRQGSGARGAVLQKALADLRVRGGVLVFLSRWLMSPLGPYVNLAAGASGMRWRRFATADLAGEAVWVGLYVGLGMAFAGSIAALSEIMGNLSGLIAALAVAAAAGLWLWRAARTRRSASVP